MGILCKHCGSSNYIKRGFVQDKQRFSCKSCNRTFRVGDSRDKYSFEKKIKILKLYLEGSGIRSISRVEEVSTPLIIYWIRNFAQIVRQRLNEEKIPEEIKNIQILELDEMFSYYQKKQINVTYGWLWTESGMKLLISR